MEATFQSPFRSKYSVCNLISFFHDDAFDVRNVVLYQGLNNHTQFGGSRLNSHEITAFYGFQLDGCICHLYCNNALFMS